MLGNFFGSVAEKLTERLADIIAPAFMFWVAGSLAWVFAGSGWSRLSDVTSWLNGQNVAAKITVLLCVVATVTISAIVVERLAHPVLRLLEGYWPAWLPGLTRWRRGVALRRKAVDEQDWLQLQIQIDDAEPTSEQRLRLAPLEHRRRHRPVLDEELLPTQVGNILRAAETRPYHRYGLDSVVVWPRLWLVLPELAREELTSARAALDQSVAVVIWGLAFIAFTPLAWWAAPVGLLAAAIAVKWWVPARAEVFSDLVESAYDLYRIAVYGQLRWPLPANPGEEKGVGLELTRYLDRGSNKPEPNFTSLPTHPVQEP